VKFINMKGFNMPLFKVQLAFTHWYQKTIEADTPDQAETLAWGDDLDLRTWGYLGEGDGETKLIEEITE
jgi:hypothetical protein